MNPVITALLVLLPLALIMGCAAYLAKRSAAGMPVKRTLALNLSCFLVVLLIAGCLPSRSALRTLPPPPP